MADDVILSSQVQPNVNIIGGLKSLAELQMAEAHASLFSTQARLANMRQQALQQYAIAKAKGDPNALNIVAAVDPNLAKEMQSFEQTGAQISAQNKRGDFIRKGDAKSADLAVANFPDVGKTVAETEASQARAGHDVIQTQIAAAGSVSGNFLKAEEQYRKGEITPVQYRRAWNMSLKEALDSKLVSPMEYNNMFDQPNPELATRLQSMAVSAKDRIEQSGLPAANKAAAELPYKTQEELNKAKIEAAKTRATPSNRPYDANRRADDPNALDNLNLGYGAGGPMQLTPGAGQGQSAPGAGQGQAAPGAGQGQAAPPPMAAPAPAPGTAPVEAAAPAGAPPVVATNAQPAPGDAAPKYSPPMQLFYDSAPVKQLLPHDPNMRPGDQQGLPKNVEKMIGDTAEHIEKTVITDGNNAQKNVDALSRMESLLSNGGVKTSSLTPLKKQTAAAIYALTNGNLELTKKLTGMDLAKAEEFEKESTRMGLTFARQTEGAREAVQAIRIALGANPQLTTTTEGNMKIIQTLKAAAEWDRDKAVAASVYADKQAKEGQGYHYVGFEQYWNKEHPLIEYTSKIIPLAKPTPSTINDMQKGVTYNTTNDVKNPKPMIFSGKYAENGAPLMIKAQ